MCKITCCTACTQMPIWTADINYNELSKLCLITQGNTKVDMKDV